MHLVSSDLVSQSLHHRGMIVSFGQGIAEKVSLSSLPTELVFYSSGKKLVFHPSHVTRTIEVVVCAAFSLSCLLQVFVAFTITAIVVGKFILEQI